MLESFLDEARKLAGSVTYNRHNIDTEAGKALMAQLVTVIESAVQTAIADSSVEQLRTLCGKLVAKQRD